jgi:putative addiction module killer protein
MIEVRLTDGFAEWLAGLRDSRARARITMRLDRIEDGNFGDAKSIGGGVSELRIDYGSGYRVYFTRRGKAVVILLCGGDKGSQSQDIVRAKALAATL